MRENSSRGSSAFRSGFYGSVARDSCGGAEHETEPNPDRGLSRGKAIAGRLAASLLLLVVFLVSSCAVLLPGDEGGQPSIQPLVLVPHGPIFIASDTALEDLAALEGWTGDGSEVDPFVIEDYAISVSGSGAYGVSVWNTTAFLTVRNCTVQGDWNSGAGILFANATNATAIGNRCHSFAYGGVSLVSSSACTVTNNTCTSNSAGVYLQESPNNTIIDNDVSDSGCGIRLIDSRDNLLKNNTCCGCGYGIYLNAFEVAKGSPNNTLSDNNCSSCTTNGIFITRYCDNTTIDPELDSCSALNS